MRNTKKLLSFLLVLSMVLSYVPMPALAAEDGTCPHHTHDDQCGYVEAVEGQPCTHKCTESCNTKDVTQCIHDHGAAGCVYTPAADMVPCDHTHDENCNYDEAEDTCDHQHGECAYKEAVEESWSCGHVCTVDGGCITLACSHVCPGDNCGFVQAVTGHACDYVCAECESQPQTDDTVAAVQALVDALPDTVTAENKASVGDQLNALIRAYQALEETQQARVDLTKYDAAIAAMHALEGQAGAQIPQTLASRPHIPILSHGNTVKDTWVLTIGKTGEEFYNKAKGYIEKYNAHPQHAYIAPPSGESFMWSECKTQTFTDGTYKFYPVFQDNNRELFAQEWIVNVQVRHRVNVTLDDPTGCGGVANTNGGNMVGGQWVKPGESLTLRVLDVPGYKPSVSGDFSANAIPSGNGYTEYTFNNVGASGTISFSYSEDSAAARVFENDGAVNVTVSVNGKNRNLPTYLPKYITYTYTATTTDGSNISEVKANGETVYSGPADKTVTFTASPKGASELEFKFTTVENGIVLKPNPSIDYRDSMSADALAKAVFTAAFDTVYPASDQSKLVVENVNAPSKYAGNSGADVQVAVYYSYGVILRKLQDGTDYFGDSRAAFGDSDTEDIQIRYESGTEVIYDNTYRVKEVFSDPVTLTLNKLAIEGEKITKTYDGSAIALTANDITCTGSVGNVSYAFEYVDEAGNSSADAPVNAGVYDVKVTATDSMGSSSVILENWITITPVSLADAAVTLEKDTYTYDSTAKTPGVAVMLDGDTLKQNEDYDVTYQNNINAGTAYVVITGKGNYEGQVSKSFQIEGVNASDITVIVSEEDVIYDGSPKMPFTLKLGEEALIIDKDYTAAHGDNINAGNVEVTFSSTSWKGTITKTFKIQQKELTGLTIVSPDKVYDGSAVATNASVAFSGAVAQDQGRVQISADIVYKDANAGENKPVTATDLTITGEQAGNYCLLDATLTGTGTISPMLVTVTADNLSKTYGAADPELTWSVSPEAVEGDVLSIRIFRNEGEDVVENGYPITVSQGENENPNYKITFKEGTFTINPKPLTIGFTIKKQFDNTAEIDPVKDTFEYSLTQDIVLAEDEVKLDTYTGTASFASSQEGEDIKVNFVGDFTISGGDAGNYTLTQPTGITGTIYNSYDASNDFTVSPDDWTKGNVTITAEENFQLAKELTGDWSNELTYTQEATSKQGNKATFYVKKTNGDISKLVEIPYFIDKTNPTGTITMEENSWAAFLNDITFELFFNKTVDVTVTARDNLANSDELQIAYYEAKEGLSQKDIMDLPDSDWKAMTGGTVSVTADNAKQFIYYAKITDVAGNVTYLSTDGAVFDTKVPVITISDPNDDHIYYTTKAVTVSDTYFKEVTLMTGTGAPVAQQHTFNLTGNEDTEYIIEATDKAGNSTTVTVTMKPIETLDDALDAGESPMTVDNVKLSDKTAITAIRDQAKSLMEQTDVPGEDAALQQIIDRMDTLLDAIAAAEAVIRQIEALPAADKAEPDSGEHLEVLLKAQADYDVLIANGKTMVGAENKAKLDAVATALRTYRIIAGDGGKYTKYTGKTLSFTANGPVKLELSNGKSISFKGIFVDGAAVDAKIYTVASGSTVVTLTNTYLDSLAGGKHTIVFLYDHMGVEYKTNEASFRVSIPSDNPKTGDFIDHLPWVGMAMTSLLCMAMMIVFFPRKMGKYQR